MDDLTKIAVVVAAIVLFAAALGTMFGVFFAALYEVFYMITGTKL